MVFKYFLPRLRVRILDFFKFSIFSKIFFQALVQALVNLFKKSRFLPILAILRQISALGGKQTNFFFENHKNYDQNITKKIFKNFYARASKTRAFENSKKRVFSRGWGLQS